jgi:hypothetical protein
MYIGILLAHPTVHISRIRVKKATEEGTGRFRKLQQTFKYLREKGYLGPQGGNPTYTGPAIVRSEKIW